MQEFFEEYILVIFAEIDPALMKYLSVALMIAMLFGLFYLVCSAFIKKPKTIIVLMLILVITFSITFVIDRYFHTKYDYDQGFPVSEISVSEVPE